MVKPLKYHSGLNLQEAEDRYSEIKKEFERVKSHYSGFLGKFKKNLNEGDKKTLTDCVGVLLPLSLETSVQKQQTQKPEDALVNQVLQLNYQITDYLANFKNTGVTRLRGNFFP